YGLQKMTGKTERAGPGFMGARIVVICQDSSLWLCHLFRILQRAPPPHRTPAVRRSLVRCWSDGSTRHKPVFSPASCGGTDVAYFWNKVRHLAVGAARGWPAVSCWCPPLIR